ncbi:MAG: hypothetical protein KBB39_07970 [Phycicoccus sp.]|nr:hypothetical protein [Phycicoccus sp.]
MQTLYAVGVDVGGSSTKAAIHALDGRLVGSASVGYVPVQPAPGVAEYDPAELTAAAERSIRDTIRASGVSPRDIVAVTCDAMISGAVGLAADGTPSTAYTTTLDTRFNHDLDRMLRHADAIRSRCGSGAPVVAAKIAWYRDRFPKDFARTARFVLAGGLIGGHLAGLRAEDAFVDPTVLWAVGLSDTRALRWSEELLEALDIPEHVLPRVVPSTTVVGGITPEVAARTGLRSGTPVVAGCGDQMAGFLGADVLRPGVIGDSSGTYEVVGRSVTDFAPDPGGHFDVIPSALGTGYVKQSVVAIGGGFTWAWLCDNVLQLAPNDRGRADALAAQAPAGSDGLLFLPHLGGQGAPSRPAMRGGWLGLGWEHGQAHLARSVMEAIAFEIASAATAFGPLGEADRIIGYGGGARSEVAAQIRADVAGVPFHSLGDITPAALAAALLGAQAVGELMDLPAVVRATLPSPRIFTPNHDHARTYAVLRQRYAAALAAVGGLPAFGG